MEDLMKRLDTWAGLGLLAIALGACHSSSHAEVSGHADAAGGGDAAAGRDDAVTDAGPADDASAARPDGTRTDLAQAPSGAADFCQPYWGSLASYLGRCLGGNAADLQGLLDEKVLCDRFVASVAAGRTRFDAASVAACLAQLPGDSTSCELSATLPPDACASVLQPLVPVGGSCKSFYLLNLAGECAGGAFCNQDRNLACTGTCVAYLAPGAACDPDLLNLETRCSPGTSCDEVSKRCLPSNRAAAGQPCGGAPSIECQRHLYCERLGTDGGTTGVCRAARTSGPCASRDECAAPTHCAGPAGNQSCIPYRQPGESCTPGEHQCTPFAHCGSDGKCSDRPAALDEPCGRIGDESVACGPGAYCAAQVLSAGTCQPQKKPGDACTGVGLSECDGNNGHCDSASRRCVACDP
jgi:hypothetical protein